MTMKHHITLRITAEEVESHPNNYSLGEYIRSKYHQAQKEQGSAYSEYPNDGNPEESDEAYTLD